MEVDSFLFLSGNRKRKKRKTSAEQRTPDHAAQSPTRKANAGRHGRECHR